jgi:integrase
VTRRTQTPCRIHDKLLPLLLAWREQDLARGITRVIHRDGKAFERVSKGFKLAAMRACLDWREIDGVSRVNAEALSYDEDEGDDTETGAPAAAGAKAAEPGEEAENDELAWPTPHILRHTRATLMLRASVPVVEVADYFGMSPAMVLKVYDHTSSEYQKRAAAA